MKDYELNELTDNVKYAIHCFINNDTLLLSQDTHEQAVSHRIAVYIEQKFDNEELSVDCEYNRNTGDIKRLPQIFSNEDSCLMCKDKAVRPDIIVHKRNCNSTNLIVIEIKKNNDSDIDINKLKQFTSGEYGYKLGVFINFFEENPLYTWFSDGEEVSI
jgi:hypothetical protein